ncbi:carbamoyl-phosphate synthase (glutamine-hydrolyzing) large subunit [Clostridium cellulovorans]|uniref:Carbamoyl phosphate synthase large chain n=1 Tax=Clostridium cellulovorans (strain ATCC 35296 / DSM 3052 / OCM 3 / 743B) TaxID=573061 RepID=D9SLR9_CLOC7|nr:carbamoyl-phosphate synthase (glutamine-hydrolyzing) large subunit [Clostridium cellulovorans]ADL53706.1 carbamoyl-phosphate synthase, large subunit [Clostridium cellulovorans 743B]
MKKSELKKVLIIGSGPIIIGQAAEFDYSGTQGCKALREEGIEVILLNSNPATIMTDFKVADRVYIEPMTLEACEEIIKKERPQGIIATLGGQTALNLACQLSESGILEKYNVKLLGTSVETIEMAEDREKFKKLMEDIKEPMAESEIVTTIEAALNFAKTIGYPVIVRPAYTLGGTGGGIADNEEQLKEIAHSGIALSPIGQILVEKSLLGYKEIEYEVMRDSVGTCITICNMENIDPVGVHTGDSIVVAPTQTLNDEQYHLLRTASLKIIDNLKIEGGCNVQFALSPYDNSYYVIEVNPRVSRSSALASKVTGYPIAKVAAKIAIGYSLFEIINPITKKTACFEPALDYVVVKVPKWPFDKFVEADDTLGTQMKATGEGMAIDTTFEAAFMKAVYSLNMKLKETDFGLERIYEELKVPTSNRILWLMKALELGVSKEKIQEITKITPWFLDKFMNIINHKKKLEQCGTEILKEDNLKLLTIAKVLGISDEEIGDCTKVSWEKIREYRKEKAIMPTYKMVDTCAGEFYSDTPYYYSNYGMETEAVASSGHKVIILGSGPIKIGQGIEFDYACVHCAMALKEMGIEAIMINNNPETVSTDFDTSDKLYFEPLTLESVLNIIEVEKPMGVIAQFGGQTSLNLVAGLQHFGVNILGTSTESLDIAEDRSSFEAFLEKLGIERPMGKTAVNLEEARTAIKEIGFPALIRPSYVIGGEAMMIVRNQEQFEHYMSTALRVVSNEEPILIDKYIEGKEVEIDGIGAVTEKGYALKVIGIMEHIERAGIHSGDSMTIYPPKNLSEVVLEKIQKYSRAIADGLKVIGMINIQYVVKDEQVYVIEVNPRASRTVPIFSKATGVNVVEEATRVMVNKELGKIVDFIEDGMVKEPNFTIVKGPVFSYFKLKNVNSVLGPQMKSTGEVMGVGKNVEDALAKTFAAIGNINDKNKKANSIIISLYNKEELTTITDLLKDKGLNIYASKGTYEAIEKVGIKPIKIIDKENTKAIEELVKSGEIKFVINTSIVTKNEESFGKTLRSASINYGIPCFTCLDTAIEYIKTLEYLNDGNKLQYGDLRDYEGEIYE